MEKVPIKELVKDNTVIFAFYRQENFYYTLLAEKHYLFPVPIDDIGNATMLASDKAITFMRWIRMAQDSGQLIELPQN